MPLVYLPDRRELFLWGQDRALGGVSGLASLGKPAVATVVAPEKTEEVDGVALSLLEAVAGLAMIRAADVPTLPGSAATWALACKLALDLVSRERAAPTVLRHRGMVQAQWRAALSAPEDASQVAALGHSMPPSAHAVLAPGGSAGEVWAREALLRAFLDAAVDTLVRAACAPSDRVQPIRTQRHKSDDDGYAPWEQRWRSALEGSDSTFAIEGFAERNLVDDLSRWSEPAIGSSDRLRACFRLELPEADREPFTLRFLLQSPDDPSLLVTAAEVWGTRCRSLEKLGRGFRDPQESLLEAWVAHLGCLSRSRMPYAKQSLRRSPSFPRPPGRF